MTEKTDPKVQAMAEALAKLRQRIDSQNGVLMLDIQEKLGALRAFLLGDLDDGRRWPNGEFSVRREPANIVLTLHLRQWRYEAQYRGQGLFELLEIADTDLAENTVPWQGDWRQRQAEQRRLDRALDGSS